MASSFHKTRFRRSSTRFPDASFTRSQGVCYVNPRSSEISAHPPANLVRQSVGIDTLDLMVMESGARTALSQLSDDSLSRFQQELKGFGGVMVRFTLKSKTMGWVDYNNVKFSLSVALSANLLGHGRAHNSYVASRGEVREILRRLRKACARAGVPLDPLLLKVLRLDLFVDALLSATKQGYFDLLKLMSRSADLPRGLCYENGIYGLGKGYTWSLYGKGHRLLRRAQRAGCLEALLIERPREEWKQLFRLEMRCKKAAAVRSAFGEWTLKGQPGAEDEDAASADDSSAADEKEAAVPRLCVGELLERWDELPQIFTKAVSRRCLTKAGCDLAKGVAAARERHDSPSKRSGSPTCSVARVSEKMRALAVKKGLPVDWTLLEKLPAYDAPSPTACPNWMSYSPLCLLREHLTGVEGLDAERVSNFCASYQRAIFERATCQGSDVLKRYEELERVFVFDVQEMSSGTGKAVETVKHTIRAARGRLHPLRPYRVSALRMKPRYQVTRSRPAPCRADVTSRSDLNSKRRNRMRCASSIVIRYRSHLTFITPLTCLRRCGKRDDRLGCKPVSRPHPIREHLASRPLLCPRAPPLQAFFTGSLPSSSVGVAARFHRRRQNLLSSQPPGARLSKLGIQKR